ncbi:BA75_04704T0 [Komagataella pastoris]|uniref:BA75_04704T0 n=1 Tax=Komagataella pastoris TaxID=4922 RepID=A0A1B2JGW4_PICPA|nr:BA75_04704T0 [Komagataella pastoris]
MPQCSGITLTGKRCKINTKTDRYCRYHENQELTTVYRKPASPPKVGFIYVYTLKSLALPSNKKQKWLRLGSGNHSRDVDLLKSEPFDPRDNILIKVGATTNDPQTRIRQWEDKCKLELALITPKLVIANSKSRRGLSALFQKLSLNSSIGSSERQERKLLRQWSTYTNLGFQCNDVFAKEEQIHSLLRANYGHGTVFCQGCSRPGRNVFLRHREWFLIPRKEIFKVFVLIDKSST